MPYPTPMAPNLGKRSNEVLRFVYSRGGARTTEVATHIGTATNVASNYLRRLEKSGYFIRPYAGFYVPATNQK